MAFSEKLDELARAKAEARKAEIERLLAQNAGKLLRASEISVPRKRSPGQPPALLEALPGAQRLENSQGGLICTQTVLGVALEGEEAKHPRGYSFSPTPARPVPTGEQLSTKLEFLSNDEFIRGIPLERLAFLDLETTGLSGACGTYPFLIGLGYFRSRQTDGVCEQAGQEATAPQNLEFVCEQFFMEDFSKEAAVLAHLKQRLEVFDGFVTYNGKTFDVPLLRGRCIMNRMRVDFERPHLDLLHVSRRLYRPRIGPCNLSCVEHHILELVREHDIDGSLVPRIYFDYLRDKWPERLVPVFDHNVQDVVSMGALLLLLLECTHDPAHPRLSDARDLAALGRLHSKRGSMELAVEFLERAALHSREIDLTNRTLRDLAGVYKKLGRVEQAVEVWQEECSRKGAANEGACIELLKLYEHRVHDFEAALELIAGVDKQLELAQEMAYYAPSGRGSRPGAPSRTFLKDLAARKARIERKLANRQRLASRRKKKGGA